MVWFKRSLAGATLAGGLCCFSATIDCIRLGQWPDAAVGGTFTMIALIVTLCLVLPWDRGNNEVRPV